MSDLLPSTSVSFAIVRSPAPIRTQVQQRLRQAILTGHFRPGDRLVERELCALLGVSRTPVREALRHLEDHGLVVTIPQKGLVVATMTGEEAAEVFQVRAAVESLASRLFAEHATREHQATLQAAMAALEAALQANEVAALVTAKEHFYAALLAGAANRTLTVIVDSLRNRITWLRYLTLAAPGRASQSVAEMQHILAAVLSRDTDRASVACIDHVEAATAVAKQVLLQHNRLA
jgi:GntR family transcriptional regulator, trigonelline degradation regulator